MLACGSTKLTCHLVELLIKNDEKHVIENKNDVIISTSDDGARKNVGFYASQAR